MSLHQLEENTPRINRYYDMVIVGVNLVSLRMACEAVKNEKSVLMIEKSSEADTAPQSQVIVLDRETKQKLIDLIGEDEVLQDNDMTFLGSLSTSEEVNIKDIYQFLNNRIAYFNRWTERNEFFLQNDDMGGRDIDNRLKSGAPIKILHGVPITSIDATKGKILLKLPERDIDTHFNHLVVANNETATIEKINDKLMEKEKINSLKSADLFHLEATLEISRLDNKSFKLPKNDRGYSFLNNKKPSKSKDLYALQFHQAMHQENQEKKVECHFVGEVTKEIYDAYQKLQANVDKEREELEGLRTEIGKEAQQIKYEETLTKRNEFLINYAKKAVAKDLRIKEDELKVAIPPNAPNNTLKVSAVSSKNQTGSASAQVINNRGIFVLDGGNPLLNSRDNGFKVQSRMGQIIGGVPMTGDYQNYSNRLEKTVINYNQFVSKNNRKAALKRKLFNFIKKIPWLGKPLIKIITSRSHKKNELNLFNLQNPLATENGRKCMERYIDHKFGFDLGEIWMASQQRQDALKEGERISTLPAIEQDNAYVKAKKTMDEELFPQAYREGIEKKLAEWKAFFEGPFPSVLENYKENIRQCLRDSGDKIFATKDKQLIDQFNQDFKGYEKKLSGIKEESLSNVKKMNKGDVFSLFGNKPSNASTIPVDSKKHEKSPKL